MRAAAAAVTHDIHTPSIGGESQILEYPPDGVLGRFNLYCVRFLLPRVPLSALQSAWPIAGATAKRSLGVPCSTSATTTPPNEFGGGTRDDVRVDTVLIKMP